MNLLEYCIDKIAPNYCLFCASIGKSICDYCYGDIVPCISSCYHCFGATEEYETCKVARKNGSPERVFFITPYNQTSKTILLAMKNESKRDIAVILSNYLDEAVPYLEKDWVVVPVATISKHVRERGFDHTKMIAKAFAKTRHLKTEILITRLDNAVQKNKTKKVRYEQAAQSYMLKSTKKLPKKVLLIDDMITSGATLETITKLLKASGVKIIWATVFARKS